MSNEARKRITSWHLCADFYLYTAGMWIELYILVLLGISLGVCEKYYFAEQRDVLFMCAYGLSGDEDRPRETWQSIICIFNKNSTWQFPPPLFTPYCMERYLAKVTLLKLLFTLQQCYVNNIWRHTWCVHCTLIVNSTFVKMPLLLCSFFPNARLVFPKYLPNFSRIFFVRSFESAHPFRIFS